MEDRVRIVENQAHFFLNIIQWRTIRQHGLSNRSNWCLMSLREELVEKEQRHRIDDPLR